MARAGLGAGWRCLFANDFDLKKGETYRANWGGDELFARRCAQGDDRRSARPRRSRLGLLPLPGPLARRRRRGARRASAREASGRFSRSIKALRAEGRHPPLLVLENVCGALTSHGGEDFTAICRALAGEGYRFGALIIDAALFVPQSRPRLFIVALHGDVARPAELTTSEPSPLWHSRALDRARMTACREASARTTGSGGGSPRRARATSTRGLIDEQPHDVAWHRARRRRALLAKMSDRQSRQGGGAKARRAAAWSARSTGARATTQTARKSSAPKCVSTISPAACARRPAAPAGNRAGRREGARALATDVGARDGAADGPAGGLLFCRANYNDAYHLVGDGVVVPVVRHLAANICWSPCSRSRAASQAAA